MTYTTDIDMKAILKKDRKVIIDVQYIGETPKMKVYRDRNTKEIYFDFQLELIEYYGD